MDNNDVNLLEQLFHNACSLAFKDIEDQYRSTFAFFSSFKSLHFFLKVGEN